MKKKKKKSICDLCNTEAENETEISAPPPPPSATPPPPPRTCMHVPFLFPIINFVFITNLQFQNSKLNNDLLLYTRVYYNVHVYEHTCSLFHG